MTSLDEQVERADAMSWNHLMAVVTATVIADPTRIITFEDLETIMHQIDAGSLKAARKA